MTRLRGCRFAFWATAKLLWLCLALGGFASEQILNEDNEIQVHDLPSLMSRTPHSSDVLARPVGYFCPVLTADGKLDCAPK
jgi:hypothetical protein